MHFTTDQRNTKTIFRLKEERLDSRNAGHLKAEFLILAQPGTNAIIVDLSEVQHVDSAGLSALLLGQRQMRLNGGELRLAGLNASVRSLLEITQLNRMFPIFATVPEAMSAKFGFFPDTGGSNTFFDDDDEEDEIEGTLGNVSGMSNSLGPSAGDSFTDGIAGDAWSDLPTITSHIELMDYAGSLGPGAPTAKAIRAGAIAAGGSFGAAALTNIMMTPDTFELNDLALLNLGDEEEDEEEDHDLDDIDDLEQDFTDDDDDDDDLDEEDDVEDVVEETEDAAEVEPVEEIEDLDEDFEDDDWDEEELEEDEEEDY
jgi:anti-sigma B factor antagonist